MGEPAPSIRSAALDAARAPASSAHRLAPGDTIADRYQLVSEIGCGAMGAVWAARHMALGSVVAIKFLHPETVASEETRERFAREARIAARLGERCRYVVRVMDYGVVDEVGPFLVMEYLRGEALSARVQRQGPVPLYEAVHIVAQLCRALAIAHQKGVVHRDVKPGNVFLARPNTNMAVFVKLMDFGVAKLLDRAAADHGPATVTRAGAVIGTPAYMSPEQLLAQAVDHRSDLWGVATTVYRILTGELPFETGTLSEMGVRIVTRMPRPPSELNPSLPKTIDAWMTKALAKSPDDRFQSARELSDAFATAAGVDLGSVVVMPRAIFPTPTPVPSSELLLADSGALPPAEPEPATVRASGRPISGMRRVHRPARSKLAWAVLSIVVALSVAMAGAVLVAVARAPQTVNLQAALAGPLGPQGAEPPVPTVASVAPPPAPTGPGRSKPRPHEQRPIKPAKN